MHCPESKIYRTLVERGFYSAKRPLIEHVLENLGPGVNVVQLPTGYGKTSLSIACGLKSIVEPREYLRSIHVLPLRSIIDDAYKSTVKNLQRIGITNPEEIVAEQMMGAPGSPFLNKDIVFVTYETFKFHMMKTPPHEIKNMFCSALLNSGWRTYGHFEISRGAIFESAVFLDEPQLMIDENDSTLPSILYALACHGGFMTLMSATVSKSLRNLAREAASAFGVEYREMIYGENMFDKDFENTMKSKKIETYLEEGSLEDVVRNRLRDAVWDRVLIMANTVEKAKHLYRLLSDADAVLLHGRLTKKDRQNVLDNLKNGKKWVVVSTQVVEAGVNISSELMITELAPASSLVQRAGRVARYDNEQEGMIVVVKAEPAPYSGETVEKTYEVLRNALNDGGVSWRVPSPERGIGYSQLVDMVHGDQVFLTNNTLLNQMINPVSTPHQAQNLIRDTVTTVYVADDIDKLEKDNSFTTDLQQLAYKFPQATAIIQKKEGLTEDKSLRAKDVNRSPSPSLFMLCKDIVGFLISEEEYRNEAYGI
ncbi:CRISPR-associated helicase Cas3 [Candidatus Caldarchaeum subterraneum]|uniref:CRISPR-associated helicase Cas3 n=1 Tax=Caldiarchaeum subterraneum TaxID=311458 RepID=E6N6X3_CALS0|nr:CRISPR-associated helicase Cas3 [Candidatus Caldarchaeum subterraneum]BAJ48053.1 CRISPR-associated helicase Cas3 [Candidatus Caldarchaeum subterraneum]BAJ50842.1 CRISPR-associated helicase Cas3 [Candidatus Caldarchaeum subterraneum]